MEKNTYNVIGVMSGTSLDGVDIAYLNFKIDGTWTFEMQQSETLPYSDYWLQKLKNLTQFSLHELKVLDENYTDYLGEIINQFIKKNHISTIDAVCSHGHTALHQPENALTYQIGNLPKLASLVHQKVVCDFRVQDVEFGGQGAPLVPIGDELLFSQYEFCVNLGGFANISTKIDGERIAYDICPVNIVLNHYVNQMGQDYDDKGQLAASGTIHQQLLKQLNSLEFYQQDHPKSLGLEWVQSEIFPLIDSLNLQIKDVLRTFVEHVSNQISKEINSKKNASVLITGGGAFNDFLIERIKAQTQNKIVIPHKIIVDFKEALIFGLLGVLKLRNEINVLSSVTGAKYSHSSGVIFFE